MDGIAQLPPPRDGTFETVLFRILDGPVECDPGHYFRMRELPGRPADFPQSLIGDLPVRLQKLEQSDLDFPGLGLRRQTGGPREMQGIHDFAVDIQLELLRCGVPDSHRGGFLVARQPRQFLFIETARAGDAVEDLQIVGRARYRTQQPFTPGGSLVLIAGEQQCVQGKRRVAQPAVTVIPVPHAPRPFGQRRCGCRDQPAGWFIGERLERNQ